MLLQGIAILLILFSNSFIHYISISVVLGIGTAIVYPTFLSSIAEDTNPEQRAKSLGAFRFWRDLGYVFGACLTGVFTDVFLLEFAIALIAVLTILSSFIIIYRMHCRPRSKKFFSLQPHSYRQARLPYKSLYQKNLFLNLPFLPMQVFRLSFASPLPHP